MCADYDERLLEIDPQLISALFILDTITFWQNMLQMPVQQVQTLAKIGEGRK
jgi:hypothetical protein